MSTPKEPDYANKNITLLKDARVDAISLVDVGANNQTFFLFKRANNIIDESGNLHVTEEDDNNVHKYLPLIKGGDINAGEDEWKVAYVVVAIPGEIDQQKDVWDADGVRDVAHDFLKRGPLINYMHEDMRKVGELVESYLAKENTNINGQDIKEGSWIIGVEPHPEVKEMIKQGKITGVSVQGSSKRSDLPAELGIVKTMDGKSVVQELYKEAPAAYMQRTGEEYKVEAPKTPAEGAGRLNPNPNMDDQVIPLGAVGPGVAKLQDSLGLEPSGTYDEDTEAAFIELLRRTGREASPTLRNLKFIIQDHDERMAMQAQLDSQNAAPPVEPAPQGPAQGMEKDHMGMGHTGHAGAGDMRGYNPAGNSYGGNVPAPFGGTYSGQLVGNHPGNNGIQPPAANLGPKSNEDDLKSAVIQASLQGNELLNSYLRDNLGVTDPYQLLYFRVAPSVLWAMVSAFILGQDPRMSFAPISSRGVVTTQPTYTPPELFPTGTGYSIQKSGETSKEKIQEILDNLDYHVNTNLQKSGWLDWVTPHAELKDKNGHPLFEHVVVKTPRGQVAVVSSIDMAVGTVNVEWTSDTGETKIKTYKASQLAAVERMEPVFKSTEMTDKNGFSIEDGAIVKILEDDQIGEVVGFNPAAQTVVVETINKDIELVKREVSADEVEVINSTKSSPANPDSNEMNSPEKDAAAVAGIVKAGPGGSRGGQDPRKFGKIRFIVRSFGKWAGGKQRVCVSRLRAEHPEVAKGKEESLCAWLKDQYLGTTKWRHQGKMLKTYGKFTAVYKSVVETGEMDITDEEVDTLFNTISQDLGLVSGEVMEKMNGDEADFDMYLDEVFGPITSEEVPKSVINKFVKIFKSDKSIDEKTKEAEEILKASEYDGEDKSMKLEAAFTAATSSIESALLKSDEEVQIREISDTVDGLKNWLADYVKNGGNVADIDANNAETSEEDNEYIPITWEVDDFVDVDSGYEPMAKRGTLSKAGMPGHRDCGCKMCENARGKAGEEKVEEAAMLNKEWMPAGTSQSDLDDGDFAWISGDGKTRKLPYKIHGKVNARGWHAAWAAINGARGGTITAGGPTADAVKKKLLRDKPKSVETPAKLRKQDWSYQEDNTQPDKKKRLKAKKTNLMEVNMKKAHMPPGMDPAAGPEAGAGAPADGVDHEVDGDKDWVGKTVIGPDGNRYIVVDQAGDVLTVAAGRKRATFSKDEVELSDEAGGTEEMPGAPVEKEGGDQQDKLRSAIEVLTSMLSGMSEENHVEKENPQPVGAVMKEANDAGETTDNSGTSLNDVIYFVNGLADQLDEMKDSYAAVGDIGPKLAQVGEMVKSVDFSDKLTAIEQRLAELENKAGESAPAETLEAVSKRLTAIERQPGNSAQLPAQTEKVEKSASDRMFRGLF